MYGANINKKDQYGNTALMYAVERHNLESINSLMKNGSNRHEKNNFQMDAIAKAKSKLNQDYLVDFIKNYPETQRKFPKFKVKLTLEDKINNPFWTYVKNFKIYDTKPKLFPFNNFKGTYRIDLTPYETVGSIL
jgi:ankyrin repeat protein